MAKDIARKIALIDLDAYFCSAETLKDPSLKDIPFAVGGKSGRGVISTANYLAREYGVKSAMSSHKAFQLCPQLKIIAGDMAFYKQLSRQIYQILCEYSPLIEQASIDEFYIDLTENTRHQGSASLTVEEIRSRIAELGVTASAGISSQRMVAKIASEDNKPNGQTLVLPNNLTSYLAQLPLKRIPGVGPVTLDKLNRHNYFAGKDIQNTSIAELQRVIGAKHAEHLLKRCQGMDSRGINLHRERKSIGAEITLEQNIDSLEQAKRILKQKVLERFSQRFSKDNSIKNQTIKLKFADFTITTVSQHNANYSVDLFYQLLEQAWQRREGRAIRLIGVSAGLASTDNQLSKNQLSLF